MLPSIILVLFLLFLPAQPKSFTIPSSDDEACKYSFTYFIQMDVKRNILFFFPFRSFYEASAVVNFSVEKETETLDRFYFAGISQPGYVMTTGGRTGNSLYFFTAAYDPEKADLFREEKLALFLSEKPYYSKSIEKVRRRPMQILSRSEDSLEFTRDHRGIHSQAVVKMKLTDSHSLTYSNIYEILGKMLSAYNHSFLPPGGWDQLAEEPEKSWESEDLDFTPALAGFAYFASEGSRKHAKIKQRKTFKMNYRIVDSKESLINILGESSPETKIGKDMILHRISRSVTLRGNKLEKDTILLDFRDEKGRGGFIRLELSQLE